MSRGVANALFLLLFSAFAFLHLYRLGVVTYTWDEGSDLGIVSCLQRTHDPFVCLDDISQTRLPFYIHAIAHTPRSQYLISAAFSLFNFAVIYAFARREFGRLAATLTAALFATSPALLASGRMLLTHSNVIFTTFTLLSFLTLKEYANGGGPSPRDAGRGWRAAPGEGRNSGSLRPPSRAPRGPPLPPPRARSGGARGAGGGAQFGKPSPLIRRLRRHLLPARGAKDEGSLARRLCDRERRGCRVARARPLQSDSAHDLLRHRRWRDLGVYALAASATFFATTVVYVQPAIFGALVQACLHPGAYPFWNVLGLGSPRAPWYFAFLILAVKVGPWLLFLPCMPWHKRFAAAFFAGFFIDLLLKGFVFHYEAPHHQVQFYPLLYLFLGAGIARVWRPAIAAVAALLFAWQLYDVVRFFPNYLFYGAQYGERMGGEVYGPAVMHDQDKGPLNP